MDLAAMAADIRIWRVKCFMPAKTWLLGRRFTFKLWVWFNAPIAIYLTRKSIHNSNCHDWIMRIWKQTEVSTLFVCQKLKRYLWNNVTFIPGTGGVSMFYTYVRYRQCWWAPGPEERVSHHGTDVLGRWGWAWGSRPRGAATPKSPTSFQLEHRS